VICPGMVVPAMAVLSLATSGEVSVSNPSPSSSSLNKHTSKCSSSRGLTIFPFHPRFVVVICFFFVMTSFCFVLFVLFLFPAFSHFLISRKILMTVYIVVLVIVTTTCMLLTILERPKLGPLACPEESLRC